MSAHRDGATDIVMSDSEDSTVTYTAVSSPFGGAKAGTTFTRYPEFMPPEDEVFPAEEQPLPAAVSPTADSPGYIADSDPEEDEEDPEEDHEEDPIDYPADGGDDDDESSNDDEDDERLILSKVARLLAIPTPPSSPLSPWSSPLPQIPSPPLPVSPPPPASPTYPLGYRAAMIRLRAEALSTSYSLPLPPPIILSRTRTDSPPSGTPPIYLYTYDSSLFFLHPLLTMEQTGPRFVYHHGRGYVFLLVLGRLGEIQRGDTWDEMLEDMPGAPATDETELGWRMTNFVTTVRQDTDEIYVRLGKTQDERSLMSGRLNLLQRDRRAHARTALHMEGEARLSREA
ncbi:hypothetical protein Tco_0526122 [Tanacetum coccineum]